MQVSKKKLLLIPVSRGVKKLAPDETVNVRINGSNGSLNIGGMALSAMCMDQKWYRTFYDVANNVIAWQITDALTKEQMESKTWKFCKKNATNNQYSMGIKRILEVLGKTEKKSWKLEVKKYLAKDNIMEEGDYYFVEFE